MSKTTDHAEQPPPQSAISRVLLEEVLAQIWANRKPCNTTGLVLEELCEVFSLDERAVFGADAE